MLDSYEMTVHAIGALALLLLVQVIVVDVLGLRSRHVPGTPVPVDHSNPLFRASRTVGNTNESIAIFVLLVIYCLFTGADALFTGVLAWAYVISRTAYAVFYYANVPMMRSVCFGLSLIVLAAMLGTAVLR